LLLAKPHVELVFRSVLGGLVDNLCRAPKLNLKGEAGLRATVKAG